MHFWFNVFEAAFWVIVGIAVLVRSRNTDRRVRVIASVASLAFLAFAATDLIELRTGAWYRPWGLLASKALCLTTLAACYGLYLQDKE
jgi:hypothetical protein